MKKILSILAAASLVASTSVVVVSCNTKEESKFEIPKFPANVDEAKKIILDLSKQQTVSELKLEEMYEQEVSDVEIISFQIKNKFLENEAIISASAFKIINEEGNDSEIKIWAYNKENVLEETSISIGNYIPSNTDIDENYYFSATVEEIINSDISLFPKEVEGLEDMINNMKEIKEWWLKARNLKSFSEQFKSEKVSLIDKDDEKEALEKAVALTNNNDITTKNTKFIYWDGNEKEVIGFTIAPTSNDKYLGFAFFELTTIIE
ncbi:lipoprotein [Spiroplasma endosymbiont of Cantharis rufa]|uniref:lipoprotein n=1 Tax=Spiroplasma endosymbiont of Cantharis rufa TaxID=3066279 RepID=UPI0030D3E8C0